MKRIRMLATRQTDFGLLRAEKPYLVPDKLADELVADRAAFHLDEQPPEAAVVEPVERAIKPRSRRRRKAPEPEPEPEAELEPTATGGES